MLCWSTCARPPSPTTIYPSLRPSCSIACSCEGANKGGVLTGDMRRNPHVQSYVVATDQVWQLGWFLVGIPSGMELLGRGAFFGRVCAWPLPAGAVLPLHQSG